MNFFILEEHILRKNNINIHLLVKNFNTPESLSYLELQAYFEAQIILYVYMNKQEMIYFLKKILQKKRIKENVVFQKLLSIVEEERKNYRLKIDAESCVIELLSVWFLCIFTNKLLACEEDEFKIDWYNSHEIFENYTKFINKFLVYFNHPESDCLENNVNKLRSLIILIINECEVSGMLKKKTIHIKDLKKTNFYSIEHVFFKKTDWLYFDLKIYYQKPTTLILQGRVYFLGVHYLSTTRVFRENIKSKKHFILNNLTILEKIKNTKYFLNYDLYCDISTFLIKKHNLENINTLQDLYKKYKQSRDLIFLRFFQKKNSLYYHLMVFFTLEKYKLIFKDSFFLMGFFDFRGRLYIDSPVSPLAPQFIRLLYHYGFYNEFELEKIHNKKPLFDYQSSYNYILANSPILDKYPLIENFKLKEILVSIVFFEFGKVCKSQHTKNFNGRFSFLDFIKIGTELFNNIQRNNVDYLTADFESFLEINYLLKILDEYNKGISRKYIIYKDSTASAIQLLMLLLGGGEEQNIKICNLLDDGYWYDTYYWVIEIFKKNQIIATESNIKFNRKNLKKSIMTFNYSATLKTSWEDFLHLAKSNQQNYHELHKDFKKFYSFLELIFNKDGFFQKPSNSLLEPFKDVLKNSQEIKILTSDNCHAFLEYKKMIKNRLDKRFGGRRFTILFEDMGGEVDYHKTFQAFKPNLIHTIDATYLRFILTLLPEPIITIHDCFGIDILNMDLLIETANKAILEVGYYNGEKLLYKKIFYSKFILL